MLPIDISPERQYYYAFIMYYWFIYMAISVFMTYIGLYYLELGYSSSVIGGLTAIGPITAIFVQPIWGVFSDKVKYRRTMLMVALAGSTTAAFLFRLNTAFIFVLFMTILYMSFFTATRPMEDAIALEYTQKHGFSFAPIRLSGTLGFAFMVLFAGQLIGNDITNLFPISAVLMTLALAIVFLFPKTSGNIDQKKKIQVWRIFSKPEILFVLTYTFIVYIALGFYNSFISIYMRSFGATNSQIGLAMSLSAFSEVPILLFINKAVRRFGSRNILLFAGLMTAFRMLIFAQATTFSTLIFSQLLHGATFITIYYCSVTIVNVEMPTQLKSTGQSILALFATGLSRIIGSLVGGSLSDVFGIDRTFYYAFWMVLIISLVFIFTFVIRDKRKASDISDN